MTDLNNTNAADEPATPTPDDGASPKDPGNTSSAQSSSADLGNLDEAWAAFQAEHEADLNDVASSRQAKKFEKQAKRRDKEALLSINDLDMGAFTDDARPGPRDFTGSSWLDTNAVMDRYDDGGFTAPNPEIGPVKQSTILLVALLIIGVIGTAVMVLIPSLYGIPVLSALLNIAFGICTVLGLGGLIVKALNRSNRPGDKGGYFDDGARV
ncbi:hypothetical protein [Bifidobacterium scaligerum]|uniref:Membrane associated protein n=1 Tax=Bifidobacterium scaligerum TaxID=2052656 RepID=A0A2M9HSE9_9BIFI|nr:hypothetical protein [Bifidobacterium scaligerum]PJM79719.1 hypothetical protein CUU80_00775 [Bifidobacterium scaligerum]